MTPIRPARVLRLTALAVGALVLAAYLASLATRYQAFRHSLERINGVKVDDTREEVLYRLGYPTYVLGPVENGKWGLSQRNYIVSAAPDEKNGMPAGTNVRDYADWAYQQPHSEARLDLTFTTSGQVESIGWYSNSQSPLDWGPIGGIRNADPEEAILSLGAPTSSSLNGVAKTLIYPDLGLEVTLTKGRAYRVILHPHPPSQWKVLRRFLRTLP